MTLHSYGVAVRPISARPRKVRYHVVHYSGVGAGVAQFILSKDDYATQDAAIRKAQTMNARRRR